MKTKKIYTLIYDKGLDRNEWLLCHNENTDKPMTWTDLINNGRRFIGMNKGSVVMTRNGYIIERL